jgi:predicted dehydrogenase
MNTIRVGFVGVGYMGQCAHLRSCAAPQAERLTLPWVDAIRQQAFNFLVAVKGDPQPPCSAAEAPDDRSAARDYITLMRGQ